jgi:hypothetical protein
MGVLKEGEFFGERSLLTEEAAAASVQVIWGFLSYVFLSSSLSHLSHNHIK